MPPPKILTTGPQNWGHHSHDKDLCDLNPNSINQYESSCTGIMLIQSNYQLIIEENGWGCNKVDGVYISSVGSMWLLSEFSRIFSKNLL